MGALQQDEAVIGCPCAQDGILREAVMARMSKAQQIARENEEQALTFFETTLGALPDPRRRQGQRYPLRTVVVTALMAMVCGCDDAEAMQSLSLIHI